MDINTGSILSAESNAVSLTSSLVDWDIRFPNGPVSNWTRAARVPGTAAANLIALKLFSEPWSSTRASSSIPSTRSASESLLPPPDIFTVGRDYYTIEYRVHVSLSRMDKVIRERRRQRERDETMKLVWVKFTGINYVCEAIEINGRDVRDEHAPTRGMWTKRCINVSEVIGNEDEFDVMVRVAPVENVGDCSHGGQGGDHSVAKDVSLQYVQGWDWMTAIADRNTGLWNDVLLFRTGPLRLDLLRIDYLVDESMESACISASVRVINGTNTRVEARFEAAITLLDVDKTDVFRNGVDAALNGIVLEAFEERCVQLPDVTLQKLKLWWPIGLGDANTYLYTVDVLVPGRDTDAHTEEYGCDAAGNDAPTWRQSHSFSSAFGVRTLASYIADGSGEGEGEGKPGGGRVFVVNGQRIFIRGVNFTISEGWMRLSAERYLAELRLLASSGVNMIRLWGGSNEATARRGALLLAAQQLGILIWFEFWITGDCNGRGIPPSKQAWPLDHALFLRNAIQDVGSDPAVANNSSIVLFCGGNEQQPDADIDASLRRAFGPERLERQSGAVYISGSLWDGFGSGKGAFDDGPYGINSPDRFYYHAQNGSGDTAHVKVGIAALPFQFGFNPEVGSVGVGNVEGLIDSLITANANGNNDDDPALEPPQWNGTTETWSEKFTLLKYIPYCDEEHDFAFAYGDWNGSGTARERLTKFCMRAQLVNWCQYKAIFEAFAANMWNPYCGVLLWKANNPWPGLRGSLYDYWLDANAGLFGVQCATQSPHVMLNLRTMHVLVVNTGPSALDNGFAAGVAVRLYAIDAARAYDEIRLSIGDGDVLPSMSVRDLGAIDRDRLLQDAVTFVRLELLPPARTRALDRSTNDVITRNLYWVHPTGDYSEFSQRLAKQMCSVDVRIACSVTTGVFDISVSHDSSAPCNAFFMRFQVLDETLVATTSCVGDTDDPCDADYVVVDCEKQRVRPSIFSSNYISLFPGEATHVTLDLRLARTTARDVRARQLTWSGWNVAASSLPLPSNSR